MYDVYIDPMRYPTPLDRFRSLRKAFTIGGLHPQYKALFLCGNGLIKLTAPFTFCLFVDR